MTARRTYWHLAGARRIPSDYEIGTSRLLYYVPRGGFEVNLPTSAWYRRHQVASPLSCGGRWDLFEAFEDPRATTYGSYVRLQRDQEAYAARTLDPARLRPHDAGLPLAWVELLERALPPFRFLGHGLQMLAAYVGQMAPGGRIAVTAAMQAADEVRRIHGIAYRMGELRLRAPQFGEGSREEWQSAPAWQPLRALLEQLLVTYDWGEALVALNLCVKPAIDELFTTRLALVAEKQGDYPDAQWLRSLAEDCAWHRAWTVKVVRMLVDADSGARAAVAEWIGRWTSRTEPAVSGLARALDPSGDWDGEAAVRAAAALAATVLAGARDAA